MALTYAATMGGAFLAFLYLPPDSLFAQPLWLIMTVFIGGGILVGLLMAVPTWLIMKRLQLWVLPRLAMGMEVGAPTIPLRIKDMYRFGWGMSTGDGRFVMDHLDMVRTGSVLGGAEEGLPMMDEEHLATIRKAARKGQWWKGAMGALAGLAIGGAIIAAAETEVFAVYWAIPALLALALPLAVLLGIWPRIKQWARAYLDWVDSAKA